MDSKTLTNYITPATNNQTPGPLYLPLDHLIQSMIPYYTGKIINYVSSAHPDEEAFYRTLNLLVVTAIVCGISSGLRGSAFVWCCARLATRVRQALFDSLLKQEVGYFDVTSTGDITSRLSSDTTKMSDQIGTNLNIFFRSVVEACLYLALMVSISWKLALLSFVSVPLLAAVSAGFEGYYRKVNTQTQDALADANTIAEETLAAMSTVRDFASEKAESESYAEELQEFLKITVKQVKVSWSLLVLLPACHRTFSHQIHWYTPLYVMIFLWTSATHTKNPNSGGSNPNI
jgi:ATP-binding cassette subfamily B (MDR/TAP) protein 9